MRRRRTRFERLITRERDASCIAPASMPGAAQFEHAGKTKGSSRLSRLDPAEYPCRLLLDASNLSYRLPDIRRLVAWVPRSSLKVSANMPQTRRNPLNV